MAPLPPFSDLPLLRPGPAFNAWGLYGEDDELGRLNLITPGAVQRGLRAATHGIAINLNLPLNKQVSRLTLDRQGLEHTIIIQEGKQHIDDHVAFNTQMSTQWDGLRHFPYKDWPEKGQLSFYNGQSLDSARSKTDARNGVQNYAEHPITSCAHLLDIPRYLKRHDLPPLNLLSNSSPVTLEMIEGCAKDEGVEFEPGDIMVLKVDHVDAFWDLSVEEMKEVSAYGGVQQTEEMLKWHWEKGIAAVVTDAPAYEVSPRAPGALSFHEIFLAGWGMPIGEWFDLRQLAKECERLNKWTFLFTSMPLMVIGGIASPPNAQAIL